MLFLKYLLIFLPFWEGGCVNCQDILRWYLAANFSIIYAVASAMFDITILIFECQLPVVSWILLAGDACTSLQTKGKIWFANFCVTWLIQVTGFCQYRFTVMSKFDWLGLASIHFVSTWCASLPHVSQFLGFGYELSLQRMGAVREITHWEVPCRPGLIRSIAVSSHDYLKLLKWWWIPPQHSLIFATAFPDQISLRLFGFQVSVKIMCVLVGEWSFCLNFLL